MTRVALVSCGKLKLDHPAPARDLYVGPLFADAKAHVLAGGYDHWFILSAEHGLVHPDRVLEPYDTTMDGLRVDEVETWARRVEFKFRLGAGYMDGGGRYVATDWPGWAALPGQIEVDIFASAAYADPLRAQWDHRHKSRHLLVTEPLRGLQMGDRRGWFKAERDRRKVMT